MAIVRAEEDIDRVRVAAQALTHKADETGVADHVAEAVYGTLQWLFGYDDSDPVEMYLGDE